MIALDALRYILAGLSVIPFDRTAKMPVGRLLPTDPATGKSSWSVFRTRQPTPAEVAAWFAPGRATALAVVAGAVSGGLEILDFDAPELFSPWQRRVHAQAPGLVEQLPIVQSQSGGFHVYYRCAEIQGSQKLAEDPTRPKRTLIETRGEGGCAIAPPSAGYRLLSGSLLDIPVLTPAERAGLHAAARSFDQVDRERPARPSRRSTARPAASGLRPGDDFNQRGDLHALLTGAGWQLVRFNGGEEYWRRPGKRRRGWSATYLPGDNGGCFYVFSSNAAPFEPNQAYTPFAVYTLLAHGGDYRAAAQALRAQGYGGEQR